MKYGSVGGDVNWGIEKWNSDSKEDHGIEREYKGYLFFIGAKEHGQGEDEHQVILSKNQIKPFLDAIIEYYSKIDTENNTNVHDLIKLSKDYNFI